MRAVVVAHCGPLVGPAVAAPRASIEVAKAGHFCFALSRYPHVGAYEGDHVIDRGDPLAGDFLIEKLRFFVVDSRCSQRNENLTVILWREFNSEKLDVSNDGERARLLTSIYV